ncbi:Vacuolar cation/proton exchanger 1a [Acorus calamus]|uniref:Vacuolar cation/proton exchanger 1a n=1 Tax=Acorus calamus TaxID=4465 RepID=A0AAV9E107_ACOCL|nr:Vacuolar cation/proton exchanger 1a [Acorus calamus]
MGSITEPISSLEKGELKVSALTNKEMYHQHHHGRSAHNISVTSLRKKSDLALLSKVRWGCLGAVLANLQEVFLGTKLAVLFPAIPVAIVAQYRHFGSAWVFALSLLGLIPLAERVSFLTEQIAYYTGPTVGGLLNATCGNATELIIALLALRLEKITVVKCSLVGSVLSNLLLVLGSSLFCGGLFNLHKEQIFERKQADVNSGLLILGLLCLMLPLAFRYYAVASGIEALKPTLLLSRICSIVMLLAYVAFLFFQMKTHRKIFEAQEDITLGVSLGSATQVSMFVIPLTVVVAWIMGIRMDLDFKLLETTSLFVGVLVTVFTLQDGTSHYMKGLVLLLCYVAIGACFFVLKISPDQENFLHLGV